MYTNKPETHEMFLEKVQKSGAEEWYCPTCGRRFLMQWPPDYKKIILDAGDETAYHSGGKGGMKIQASPGAPSDDPSSQDDPTLSPWLDWMNRSDFSSLWK